MYCTNVTFHNTCIFETAMTLTQCNQILNLEQGNLHSRLYCETHSLQQNNPNTGLCAGFIGQSTEENDILTFALSQGSSLPSASLTRSQHVCIQICSLDNNLPRQGTCFSLDKGNANAGTLFLTL